MYYAEINKPSITRRKFRGKWIYVSAAGDRIEDPGEIERLEAIGLPPAYTDAWFAIDRNAHIQATGIDSRGRKQYVYHPEFVAQRNARKFDGCATFGRSLPRIRQQVETDLTGQKLSQRRAIASIVRLLDTGQIRIGNENYARTNRSFGATTLRQRHAHLEGNRLVLRFRAKSGRLCTFNVTDNGLVRFVKQVQDLPGQHLFQYQGEDGSFHPVCSTDVNDYIHEAMGLAYTAKDFRTWAASVLAFEWLAGADESATLAEMLAHVAQHLGNTPAVARKSYIHPALIDLARSGNVGHFPGTLPRRTRWLTSSERGLIDFLDPVDRDQEP